MTDIERVRSDQSGLEDVGPNTHCPLCRERATDCECPVQATETKEDQWPTS